MSTSRGKIRTLLFGDSQAMILFGPDQRTPIGDDYFKVLDRRLKPYGSNTPSERMIAGTRNSGITHVPAAVPSNTYIHCFPKSQRGEIIVAYIGDAAHVPEFFAILDGVKKTN